MIDSPFFPFLYQYLIGGFFFFLGIFITYRKGVWNPSNANDRRTVRNLVLGFVFYFSMHGIWILLVQ